MKFDVGFEPRTVRFSSLCSDPRTGPPRGTFTGVRFVTNIIAIRFIAIRFLATGSFANKELALGAASPVAY